MHLLSRKPIRLTILAMVFALALVGNVLAASSSGSGTMTSFTGHHCVGPVYATYKTIAYGTANGGAKFRVRWSATQNGSLTTIYETGPNTYGSTALFEPTNPLYTSRFPGYFTTCVREPNSVPMPYTLSIVTDADAN